MCNREPTTSRSTTTTCSAPWSRCTAYQRRATRPTLPQSSTSGADRLTRPAPDPARWRAVAIVCRMVAELVPIRLSLSIGDRYTVWAPRWRDAGDEWEAFLGKDDDLYAFEAVPDL